jgi:hypothetical protein
MEQLIKLYNYLYPNQEQWAETTIADWIERHRNNDIIIVNLFHIHGIQTV